jgi:hypothetical protein
LGIFLDRTISGDVDFQYFDQNRSCASFAIINAATQTMTPNTAPIFSVSCGAGSTVISELADLDFIFGTGRIAIFGVNSADAIGGSFSFNWYEQQ